MRTIILVVSLAAIALAQDNVVVGPFPDGYTIYQTRTSANIFKDMISTQQEQRLAGRLKSEYSRHPDGREVLAEVDPAMIKEPGHPLTVRRIWEPNGVMTRVMVPWKQFDVVVEPDNERLSGNTRPGSATCEPTLAPNPVYLGRETLKGIDTYIWRYENKNVSTDRWYWKDANCLVVQVQTRAKDGGGGSSTLQLDRVVLHADFELFVIPSDFVEQSYREGMKRYVERTRGKAFTEQSACFKAAISKPDPYEAQHAEALRRRSLSNATNSDK